MPPAQPRPPAPAAQSVADLLAQRTALEKQVAEIELPVLAKLKAVMESEALVSAVAEVRSLVETLGPGNSSALIKHFLSGYDGVRRAIPEDVHRHEQTRALP